MLINNTYPYKVCSVKCINWSIVTRAHVSRQVDHGYLAASCRDSHGGFLCGECQEGTVKVKGVCAECPGFNWGTLATSLAINLAMGLFLVCRRPPTPLALPHRFPANYILSPPAPPAAP